ncbi:hypothetical protein, conserved [Eimeria brunetti]|uniref:Uncharacterized protein n=1 Tax=Eimeria brunetti TaxID=51314 RepID=U6LH39_9EIME|nr:hypothetical protein, conserved [Eimeria brunetti]
MLRMSPSLFNPNSFFLAASDDKQRAEEAVKGRLSCRSLPLSSRLFNSFLPIAAYREFLFSTRSPRRSTAPARRPHSRNPSEGGSEEACSVLESVPQEQPSPPFSPFGGLCAPREFEREIEEEAAESEFGVSSQPHVPDPSCGIPYAEAAVETADFLHPEPSPAASASQDRADSEAAFSQNCMEPSLTQQQPVCSPSSWLYTEGAGGPNVCENGACDILVRSVKIPSGSRGPNHKLQDEEAVSEGAPDCEGLNPCQPVDSHLMNTWGLPPMCQAPHPGGPREWEATDTTRDQPMYMDAYLQGETIWSCGDAAAVPHLLTETHNWTTEEPVDHDGEAAAAQLPVLLPQQQQREEWIWTNGHMPETAASLAREVNGVATPEALSLLSRLQGEVDQLKRQQQLQQEQQKQWQRQYQLLRQQAEGTARFITMSDPVVSRAVLNRLQAPSELAFAQRILERVASAAEPPEVAASMAREASPPLVSPGSSPAREAFLEAAALSSPGARYAQANEALARSLPMRLNKEAAEVAQSLRDLRCEFKRFSELYNDGRLLPLSVFVAALQLPAAEELASRRFPFSPELKSLRNEMIKEYLRIKRAIVLQPRLRAPGTSSGTTSGSSDGSRTANLNRVTAISRYAWESKLCQRSCLVARWEEFERRWLQERESHAVVALQPLVSAVAAAEAVLKSSKQQLVLPEPSASKQRMCTYRALRAFCSSITGLARDLLPVESSCLFLEASILVLAAAIVEAAARAAAERALERRTPSLPTTGSSAPKPAEAQEAMPGSRQPAGSKGATAVAEEWADLHLAGLAAEARVNEEDVVVYSVKRQQLNAARALLSSFFELLRQVWEARLCLTHMGPLLPLSRPALMEALWCFDGAYAEFQRPLPISLQPLEPPENPFPPPCPSVDVSGAEAVLS